MARISSSFFLSSIRRQVGKEIVAKQYGKKTVITAYRDMSRIKPGKLQKERRKKFARAIGGSL